MTFLKAYKTAKRAYNQFKAPAFIFEAYPGCWKVQKQWPGWDTLSGVVGYGGSKDNGLTSNI